MTNTMDSAAPDNGAFSQFNGKGELAGNPFPSLAQLHSMGTVVPIPFAPAGKEHQAWAVTRMEEAVRVLKDHRIASREILPVGKIPILLLLYTKVHLPQGLLWYQENRK